MIIHESNRIEDLVAELAELVSRPIGDPARAPFVREAIAVQGRGMERWLSMELSRRLGVWANPWFPFPRKLLERAFDAVLGPAPPESACFEPESLVWTLAALLSPDRLEPRAELAQLRAFLSDDPRGERRLQLAARLAQTFDDYVSYRPDTIAAWEAEPGRGGGGAASRDEAWQAVLWRDVVSRHGRDHFAARASAFLEAVAANRAGPLPGLPGRVSLFGVTTLPPLYVDVLAALASRVELHLFVLGCTREPLAAPERTNPLAASLGAVGRDFHRVLAERGLGATDGAARFRDPAGSSWLAALQRAVLGDELPAAALPARIDDGSIRIHDCYGPMREVEALHDELTALFEADSTLEPRDVVVMTPDVEQYAPFVEAVFDTPSFDARTDARADARFDARRPGERPRIPYRIADRRVRATHEIVDAFWLLLDTLAGRLPAVAVVDLLMCDRIRARFEIEDALVDRLIEWIREAGIRWGADAAHRVEVEQPSLAQNTWREGLGRLLLGFALPDGARDLFGGTLPAAGVAPGDAELLGRFVLLLETLFGFREKLASPRSLAAWSADLVQLLERMVDRSDDGASQHALLRSALGDLARRAAEAGFEEPVSLASVRAQLERSLERGVASHAFLSGGVTFCELVPMRSIPFRVVALLGLSDGAFPRTRRDYGFDLIASRPRPGDRTARDDDRHLFLEALVSARDRLVVTFVGRSPRDGSERPPSVVVDELIDEVARLARRPRKQAIEALVTRHRLHPFSDEYFREGAGTRGLVSYSASDCRAARALVAARRARVDGRSAAPGRPWVTAPLSAGAPGSRVVEVAELVRFFEHPVRFFLQRRYGLFLRDEVAELEDREPLELDALEQWQIRDELLFDVSHGAPFAEAIARLRAQGGLPPGAVGDLVAESEAEGVKALFAEAAARRGGEPLPPLDVHIALDGWQIEGELDGLAPAGRVAVTLSRLPHRCELGFWIQHLLLCAMAPAACGRDSFLVARSDPKRPDVTVLHLPEIGVPDARAQLRDLLALYEEGQRVPLPLFPYSSREQADECMGLESWPPGPVPKARARFEADQPPMGPERSEAHLLQAFRDVDPLDPDCPLPGAARFGSLARRVFEPYLTQLQKGQA